MEGTRSITFRDGSPGIVRPISSQDRQAFVEGFESLSEESRFRRFFFNKKTLTESDLERLSNPDGVNHLAYGVAAIEEDGSETPISVGHCFRNGNTTLAEVAIVTADLWQGNGAGFELLQSLKTGSLAAGIDQWIAVLLSDNTPMRRLIEKVVGSPALSKDNGNIIEAVYQLR